MLQIIPIPALNDNYIWTLIHAGKKQAVAVDPGEASPVLAFLQRQQLKLVAILTTHHHNDHIGGIPTLYQHAQVPVYGAENSPAPIITHRLTDQAQVAFFDEEIVFTVMAIPGHTLDHIAYYTPNLLFCGDTLFAAGCGRLFEGTAEQLFHSLQKLVQLPDNTLIYCTHEYTVNNLRFALTVEPDNAEIKQRLTLMKQVRQHHLPTLPTTLAIEKQVNPFLRVDQPTVIASVQNHTNNKKLTEPLAVFRSLRAWKDRF